MIHRWDDEQQSFAIDLGISFQRCGGLRPDPIGTLEPVSLGRAPLFEEIVFVVIAGLPVIAWFAVFLRTPG